MDATITFRQAQATDLDYLLWLRRETMNAHLIRSGVSLSESDQLSRVNYLFEQARIIGLNGKDIGLLKCDEKPSGIEIVQIQIDPEFQGKGIGQQIIRTIINSASEQKKFLSLTVLKENPAKALYLRMGFQIIRHDETSYLMQFSG